MIGDASEAAVEINKYAISRNAELLVAGDIFDHGERGGVSTGIQFVGEHLFKGVSKSHYIVGNHDFSGYTAGHANAPWLGALRMPGLRHARPSVQTPNQLRLDPIQVDGIDYVRGRESFEAAVVEYRAHKVPNVHVLMLHQAVKELLSFEGAYQCTSEELDGLASLIVIGDVHTSQVWHGKQSVFLSPGSPVRCNLGECRWVYGDSICIGRADVDTVGFYEVTLEVDGTQVTVHEPKRVTLKNQRQFYNLVCLSPEGQKEAIQWAQSYQADASLPVDLQKPYVRIQYRSGERIAKDLKEMLGDRAIVETSETFEKDVTYAPSCVEDEVKSTSSINEAIVDKHVNGQEYPELKSLALAILEDPRGRSDLVIEEFMMRRGSHGAAPSQTSVEVGVPT
jgi:DNA repair exonuclease SbcCD nuclease subunit